MLLLSYIFFLVLDSKKYLFIIILISLFSKCKGKVLIFDGDDNIEEFTNLEFTFRKPVPEDGIEGAVIDADPPDACSSIFGPPDTNISLNWFVLIADTFCDPINKIFNSEMAGFSAAIIYSARRRISVSHSMTRDYVPNITAVLIGQSSGRLIRGNYLYTIDKKYRVLILPNSFSNIVAFLFTFAVSAGIFLVSFCTFMVIKYLQHLHRGQEIIPLSKQHLRHLPTSIFKKGDPYETCAICLEDFKNGDELRILPCCHGYHTKCIDPWITRNQRTCPTCKQSVILGNEQSASQSGVASRLVETTPLLSSPLREGTYI